MSSFPLHLLRGMGMRDDALIFFALCFDTLREVCVLRLPLLRARPCVIHLPVAPGTRIQPRTGTTEQGLKHRSVCVLILLPPLLLAAAKPYPGGDVSDSQVFKRDVGTY